MDAFDYLRKKMDALWRERMNKNLQQGRNVFEDKCCEVKKDASVHNGFICGGLISFVVVVGRNYRFVKEIKLCPEHPEASRSVIQKMAKLYGWEVIW